MERKNIQGSRRRRRNIEVLIEKKNTEVYMNARVQRRITITKTQEKYLRNVNHHYNSNMNINQQ